MEDTHKSKPEPEAAFNAAFAPTDPADPCAVVTVTVGDRLLFGLTEADAQIMAEDIAGRTLTDEEMQRVKKGLNAGLEGWQETMETAIREAVEERDPVDTRATGT